MRAKPSGFHLIFELIIKNTTLVPTITFCATPNSQYSQHPNPVPKSRAPQPKQPTNRRKHHNFLHRTPLRNFQNFTIYCAKNTSHAPHHYNTPVPQTTLHQSRSIPPKTKANNSIKSTPQLINQQQKLH